MLAVEKHRGRGVVGGEMMGECKARPNGGGELRAVIARAQQPDRRQLDIGRHRLDAAERMALGIAPGFQQQQLLEPLQKIVIRTPLLAHPQRERGHRAGSGREVEAVAQRLRAGGAGRHGREVEHGQRHHAHGVAARPGAVNGAPPAVRIPMGRLTLRRMRIAEPDLAALERAVQSLEHPGLAARLAGLVGRPIELLGRALPESASQAIAAATAKGLQAALKVALLTIRRSPAPGSQLLHKYLAMASGAAGGTFGLAALPLELPVSTIIMLRSIAEIARSEGENLSDPEAALSCVQVFALGGRTGTGELEGGYFAVRGMLAKSVTEAARYIAERGIVEEGAPVLVRFLGQVASRFGVVVTQKLGAQAIPVIGALGGAAVNYAFIEHFQDVARGHFIVRRLERSYGKDLVRAEYERLRAEQL